MAPVGDAGSDSSVWPRFCCMEEISTLTYPTAALALMVGAARLSLGQSVSFVTLQYQPF